MTWSKRAALAAALLVVGSGSARAQVAGHPYEVSGGAGVFAADTRAGFKDAAVFQASAGIRMSPWVAFEIPWLYTSSKSTVDPNATHTFGYIGADLKWNLRPGEDRVVPYVLTGVGYGMSSSEARDPKDRNGAAGSLGLGLLTNLMNNPRLYLRLQARDIMMRDRTTETANHFAATAAVHWAFGGKYRDQDLDGVRDWIDKCPNTPIGAHVDANGCPTDADRDSVWDGIDKCPDSPVGCRVDRNGCSVDTDGDGVCDGVDQCANTPKGATVDLHGCPGDADADSVWDGIDQCANTPRGATVDEKGCPLDADRDGVPDGIDQCPSTKAGQAVDEKGCVTQWAINETDLLETGMIRLRDVRFDDGKSQLTDAVRANLDDVGKVLAKWPTLKIEVASHTDEMKTAKASRQLGEARSRAVIDQLTSKFPEIQKTNLTPKGYGGAKSGNTTRRLLEFRVLNLGELKRQLELRRQPPKPPEPSTAPPDSTR